MPPKLTVAFVELRLVLSRLARESGSTEWRLLMLRARYLLARCRQMTPRSPNERELLDALLENIELRLDTAPAIDDLPDTSADMDALGFCRLQVELLSQIADEDESLRNLSATLEQIMNAAANTPAAGPLSGLIMKLYGRLGTLFQDAIIADCRTGPYAKRKRIVPGCFARDPFMSSSEHLRRITVQFPKAPRFPTSPKRAAPDPISAAYVVVHDTLSQLGCAWNRTERFQHPNTEDGSPGPGWYDPQRSRIEPKSRTHPIGIVRV
ncbi:hypothetical protein PBRA_003105 [Plasmodiophora brassicae]|uniref:Uncharacterized protein n=1 Tax=Plasmodiophora brassicae TaxID=37360 RepID=A0A0G4J6Z3_PLABS|nr:hypothetical protein PBRA_003105 [Plasmodiophora brassicae]